MAWLHRRRAYKLSILCVTTFMTGIYCSRRKTKIIIQQNRYSKITIQIMLTAATTDNNDDDCDVITYSHKPK